jgi:AcrR family transcriptional regulator
LISPRTGRRPAGADADGSTRDRIGAAARQSFAERGFDGATLRDVARRAGVDPALIHHYFGSKEQLFVSVMQFPIDTGRAVGLLLDGPREQMGERLVRFALDVWERPETRPVLMGLLRSAMSDPVAARLMRDVLVRQGIAEMTRAIGESDPDLRAELAGSQIIGLAMARYIIAVEPLASADAETIVAIVGPTIQRYLAGPITAPS